MFNLKTRECYHTCTVQYNSKAEDSRLLSKVHVENIAHSNLPNTYNVSADKSQIVKNGLQLLLMVIRFVRCNSSLVTRRPCYLAASNKHAVIFSKKT